ncbi:unnamed protein product [marine sediment metagenome]|uniref:Uncharacterized protein n=1 Tax=marine sediment metagenome TaxID=412755 RepID=X0TE18_9ZZZZ
MDTMEQIQTEPIQSDVSESLPLEKQLKAMDKPKLVEYMNNLGYQIDGRVKEETIRENILKVVTERKSNAAKSNEESLKMAVTDKDPMIKVRFFNLESSGADLEFTYSGKRGMFGKEFTRPDGSKGGNPNGFKKCPKYHLFPGEVIRLAYSVYEHLEGLTFVTHKTVWDAETGMIKGTIPIIKPRFILQPIFSKEDIVNINKNK